MVLVYSHPLPGGGGLGGCGGWLSLPFFEEMVVSVGAASVGIFFLRILFFPPRQHSRLFLLAPVAPTAVHTVVFYDSRVAYRRTRDLLFLPRVIRVCVMSLVSLAPLCSYVHVHPGTLLYVSYFIKWRLN